ncbi:MAG TPA: DNA-processing protein DprA [Gammaproteobacteria bacterium]|nr:DNA-processing protein DprA [Gammaproteobacteria bacterium]
MDSADAWLTLVRAPGLGSAGIIALLECCGSAAAILRAPRATLTAQGLDERTFAALTSPDGDRLAQDLVWLGLPGHHLVTIDSPGYPALLREIPDPPAALFVDGDPGVLAAPQIAIVGSRNPTPGGTENAFGFARYLAGCGLTVTSGLAVGIDAAAHRGALAGGGATVAVCGAGADVVYPPRHRGLAGDIARAGALVSEFPLGTAPAREHFPRRNRIISGLSLGTLVVEAAERSGSLITARLAGEQGREVFAIPGSIHNPLARGCHRLIRQGAKLVESARDILEELGALAGALDRAAMPPGDASPPGRLPREADEAYRQLLDALGYEPIAVDRLAERTGLTPGELSSMLLILELEGHVQSVPGGAYCRARS